MNAYTLKQIINTLIISFFLIIFASCTQDDTNGLLDLEDTKKPTIQQPKIITNTNNNPIIHKPSDMNTLIKGALIDGYIADATVCIDENNDGRCYYDKATTKTNKKGEFSLNFQAKKNTNYTIIASGGIDTATNRVFNGTYKSIIEISNDKKRALQNVYITPISTLVASIYSKNIKNIQIYNLNTALAQVSKSLNLEKSQVLGNPLQDKILFTKTQDSI